MSREEHQANDFIPYPVNRVVGPLPKRPRRGPRSRRCCNAALTASIDLLYRDTGLHRLDPDGAEHGFWARLQRTLVNTLAINAESSHLARHVEDLAAGHLVVMVLASDVGTRQEIAETLRAGGAGHIGFFGPWAWQSLDTPPGGSSPR